MKENCKKTTTIKQKQTKAERSQGNRSYSESVKAKWFCCAFKLGFLQLVCKASLIFKSNLELALSIVLKQRELYESKHVSEECIYEKCCNFYPNNYNNLLYRKRGKLRQQVIMHENMLLTVTKYLGTCYQTVKLSNLFKKCFPEKWKSCYNKLQWVTTRF